MIAKSRNVTKHTIIISAVFIVHFKFINLLDLKLIWQEFLSIWPGERFVESAFDNLLLVCRCIILQTKHTTHIFIR